MLFASGDELVALKCITSYLRFLRSDTPIEQADDDTLVGGVLLVDVVDSLEMVGRFMRGGKSRP